MNATLEPIVSRHARGRMQQRGIARSAIDYLLECGREHHDHHGAVRMMLDRAAIQRIHVAVQRVEANSTRCAACTRSSAKMAAYARSGTGRDGFGGHRRWPWI